MSFIGLIRSKLTMVLGFAVLTGAVALAQGPGGQAPAAPAAPTGPLAPEKYKNIQILKDVPADQLELTMRFVAAATGMQCVECHVREADGSFSYDKDEKRPKDTAREMMKIERTVNQEFFNNRINVTCYTCHRGSNRPVSQPALAELFTADQLAAMAQAAQRGGGQGPGGAPGGGARAGAPGGAPAGPGGGGAPGGGAAGGGRGAPLPALDETTAKLVTALGGATALGQLKSLVATGTLTNRMGQTLSFSIEQKVPGRYRETVQTQPAATVVGFDGKAGWMQTGASTVDLTGMPLQMATRLADLGLAIPLPTRLNGLRVVRGVPVNGTATVGLSGTTGTYETETVYIDAASGMLLRRTISTRTALGNLAEQVDYSDFKDVAGVKVPMTIKRSTWDMVDTLKITDVKPNATLDDARFARPK